MNRSISSSDQSPTGGGEQEITVIGQAGSTWNGFFAGDVTTGIYGDGGNFANVGSNVTNGMLSANPWSGSQAAKQVLADNNAGNPAGSVQIIDGVANWVVTAEPKPSSGSISTGWTEIAATSVQCAAATRFATAGGALMAAFLKIAGKAVPSTLVKSEAKTGLLDGIIGLGNAVECVNNITHPTSDERLALSSLANSILSDMSKIQWSILGGSPYAQPIYNGGSSKAFETIGGHTALRPLDPHITQGYITDMKAMASHLS